MATAGLWIATWSLYNTTRKAVTDGEKTAKAAQIAADASVRSAKAAESATHVERAWLYFEDFTIEPFTNALMWDGSVLPKGYMIILKLKNGGRTPAIDVGTAVIFKILDVTDPVPTFKESGSVICKQMVGQGKIISCGPVYLLNEEVDLFQQGKKRLIIYMSAEYTDVYVRHARRVTRMTAFYNFNGMEQHSDNTGSHRVEVSAVGPQNKCT